MLVKIRCRSCGVFYQVAGKPVRGLDEIAITSEDDVMEMNEFELRSWQRWFWRCRGPACPPNTIGYFTAVEG